MLFTAETQRAQRFRREKLNGYFSAFSLRPLRLCGERGVTLVEMMVVVAIVGMIAGVSFPAISSGMDTVRLSSATQSVASFLNGAAVRAERRQQPVELVVSIKQNRLVLYSTQPGFERELRMPDGVRIETVLPAVDGEDASADRRFLLMPGGTVPGIGLQLENAHESRRIVRLDPMTGYPHVEIPEKK